MQNTNIKTLALAVALAVSTSACVTTNPKTGQEETSVGQTAALGASVGALAGALLGGKKGAAIGALVGGGGAAIWALNERQKELETAKLGAAELSRETMFRPVVRQQEYIDTATNEKATGLKSVDMELPLKEMVGKDGLLNDKGKAAMIKLQAVADRTGSLDLVLPAGMSARTFVSMTQTIPRAKVVVSEDKKAFARITAKPLDPSGNIRAVSV